MEVVIIGQGSDLLFCKIKSSEVKIDNLRLARVIMNSGTESDEIEEQLSANNIPVLRACTLFILRTGQFQKK